MQYFRKQNINRIVAAALLCGWLAMLLPTKYDLKSFDAFSNWLNLYVSVQNGDDAGQKIREIRLYRSDIRGFVHNAADVISRNTDLFNLPFDSSDDTDVMAAQLMAAFNQSAESGMQDNGILSVFTIKHYLTTKSIQLSWLNSVIPDGESRRSYVDLQHHPVLTGATAYLQKPLISGISIGAP